MATPKYSRDETIAAITDFYRFLVFMWMPDGCIQYPPPEGWPITENLVPRPTEKALDLLRHMPYIEYRDWDCDYDQIYWNTSGVDYTGCTEPGPHEIAMEPIFKQVIPPEVVILGFNAGRDGLHWLLDTEWGTITVYDWMSGCGPIAPGSLEVFQSASEELTEKWRCHPTYNITEFFDKIKQEYVNLEYVPSTNGEVMAVWHDQDGEKIKEIFRKHGWPGEGYQKEKCLQELEEFFDTYYEAAANEEGNE